MIGTEQIVPLTKNGLRQFVENNRVDVLRSQMFD